MEFNLENPLATYNDLAFDNITSLLLVESDHMPSHNYLNCLKASDFRQQTISLIFQVACSFDPYISYLAVNYLDRFLSSEGLPESKPWVFSLLAVSCVCLAIKMTKPEFNLADIQGEVGFKFDTHTIGRMEAIILGALRWRMRSITPFSFISFFISMFKVKDPPFKESLKARAVEIIFRAQKDIKMLEFKPSIITGSALLLASHELFPLQFPSYRKAIFNCSFVNKEKLVKCNKAMQEMVMEEYESVFDTVSSSDSPVNVLEEQFSSSESENGTIITTKTRVIRAESDKKRRKINGYCNNPTVQISQIQQC